MNTSNSHMGMHFYGAIDYAVTEGAGDYTEHGIFGLDYNGDLYRTRLVASTSRQ